MTDFLTNDTNFGILLADNALSSSQILIIMCVKFIKEIHYVLINLGPIKQWGYVILCATIYKLFISIPSILRGLLTESW